MWDSIDSNSTVCEDEVKPLVDHALMGHQATLLCFGQTGTGKTYTLGGALEFLSHALAMQVIEVMVYEIHGKKCYDLLNKRNTVFLRSGNSLLIYI